VLPAALVICWFVAAPARADFIVTGGVATVVQGSTADIPFYISSDLANGTVDLSSFQLTLQLSPVAASGVTQFSALPNQPDPFNDPNYVFYNNSLDNSPPPPLLSFWQSQFSTGGPGAPIDQMTGGDSANSGSTPFPSPATSYLLAAVRVDASAAAIGDTYTISVVPLSSQGSFSDASYFVDDVAPYSSTPVTLTVVQPSEPGPTLAPAPSSAVLAGLGGLISLLYYGTSRRKARVRCGEVA
jgi:hypothetical protein